MTKFDRTCTTVAVSALAVFAIAAVPIMIEGYGDAQRHKAIEICRVGGSGLTEAECTKEVDKIHTKLGDSYSKIVEFERLLNRLPPAAKDVRYDLLEIAVAADWWCKEYGRFCSK